jgi:tRNA pseudouridine(38-40) synthase
VSQFHVELNRLLPADVRVRSARAVPPDFSVRHSALWREYHYHLSWGDVADPCKRRHVMHVRGELDVAAMAQTLRAFEGTHDFSAFSNLSQRPGPATRQVLRVHMHVDGSAARIEACSAAHFRPITAVTLLSLQCLFRCSCAQARMWLHMRPATCLSS